MRAPAIACSWVTKIAAVGVLLASVESLVQPGPLKDDGLMSWRVGQVRRPYLVRGVSGAILERLLSYPTVLGLLALRILLASMILLGPVSWSIHPLLLLPLVVLLCLFSLRNPFGLDGADQMFMIIFLGGAIACLVGTPRALCLYLWFVALQSCLAYATAGIAKATARGWRDGTFLVGVAATRMYGQASLARLLKRLPWLATGLSRVLISWESLFPLVLLVPKPVALCFLAGGCLFHLLNGLLMGLNTFLWAFLSTYPAILFCVQMRGW